MAGALDQALGRAERLGYHALLIQIDTPGGLETSMRTMVKRMLASEIPVIAWVGPSGARAASAGVFITMAADVAAMAPGTNMGAATPINMQGPMDSTLARKAANDAAAFARTIAAQRGRNVAWAEDAVRHAVAVSETEAVEQDIVDFIASTTPQVLEKADRLEWRRGADSKPLGTAGMPIDTVEPGFRLKLLSVLADPNVAYILLMLGFYGLLFELQNPGAILPGVVGGICIILAFFALSTLPVNYAGIALIALAIVFFLAELQVASHGLLGAGGVIALILGSLFLFEGEGVRVSWGVILGATLTTAAFFLFVVGAGLRAQRRPVRAGAGGMIGARAQALERLAPEGRVRLGDEIWNARSAHTVEAGSWVEITGVDRLTLEVRPSGQEA
jgi:membrane-bound serine protease (ClpP class)